LKLHIMQEILLTSLN